MGKPSAKRLSAEPIESSSLGFKTLFDNFFSSQRPLFSLSGKVWNPPVDVYETSDSVVIKMEIAGMCRDKLEILAEGGLLVIRGSRRDETLLPKENHHLMEIRYGHFERVFRIPGEIRNDEIEARYDCGFLLVTVARRPSVSRQIPIEVVE
jgi:HSP20 family protein